MFLRFNKYIWNILLNYIYKKYTLSSHSNSSSINSSSSSDNNTSNSNSNNSTSNINSNTNNSNTNTDNNNGKCNTISNGVASAAMMINSLIPLFKVLVASFAPFLTYLYLFKNI